MFKGHILLLQIKLEEFPSTQFKKKFYKKNRYMLN